MESFSKNVQYCFQMETQAYDGDGPGASSIIYKLTISTTVFIHYLYIQLSGLRGLCGIVMIIIAIAIDECYWDHEHIALLIGNDGDN